MQTEKEFDLIIFGATGFTGKTVVINLLKIIDQYEPVKWALSGRSGQKLKTLVEEITAQGYNVSQIPLIISNVNEEESLKNMTKQTRVLVNCVGPYTLYGEKVVKACIETQTHCLDITAEVNYMAEIIEKYHQKAKEANVLIIIACGFGSIPGDMGVAYLKQQFKGELNVVKFYNEINVPKEAYIPFRHTLLHYGTWESLIYVLADFHNSKHKYKSKLPLKDEQCFFHRYNGKLWVPYPGPDEYVIEQSQFYLAETKAIKPVPCRTFVALPILLHYFVLIPGILLLYFLCGCAWTRKMILKYPRIFSLGYFSHKGPNEYARNNTTFRFNIEGHGTVKNGTESKTIKVIVSGIDPGYDTTSTAFILSALTVCKETSKIPKGGVLTTASAFYDTKLVQRLTENGIKFEVSDL